MRPNKFNAKKAEVDGIAFDSKLEASRYRQLRDLQTVGEISGLELQIRYDLAVNGLKVCRYIADFRYRYCGTEVVEDAKGMRTAVYAIKAKLMLAVHGITVKEYPPRKRKRKAKSNVKRKPVHDRI